ncbi:MAG: hypothetical protein JWN78_2470 [Bacteroidota bacterium]|nr:hypothetical protein [Bacteroidota bacterium]
MTDAEKDTLLKELIHKKELAFKDATPNAPALKNIVSQLNSLTQEDKYYFKDFATKLKADFFTNELSIIGIKLEQFEKQESPSTEEITTQETTRFIEVQTNYNELFKALTQKLNEHFEIIKGYFIVKLENDRLESYNVMVLYDETFFIQPIRKKLSAILPGTIFKKVKEYSDDIQQGKNQEGNLLCLLLLHPRTNDIKSIDELNEILSKIISSYSYFEYFSLKSDNDYTGEYFQSSISKEDFFEEIRFVNGTLLSNGAIKHEEEKIIKKLCRNFRTPLIIYKTLKDGNSGCKVIEVRPKKELGPDHEKRYIIKYCAKDDKRKILKEYECFGKFIEGYKQFNEYECQYDKTLIYEGLRYSYAISDIASESFSYNEILSNKKNIFHGSKTQIVDEVFNITLFKTWIDSVESIECTCSDLYSAYLKANETIEEVGRILNLNAEQIKKNELIINFEKIWSAKYKFHQKICHGDLHSENFFKDNQGIYLIDFGYTGIRHAFVDHTALECSVKFKHIPFYIEISELNKIEDELILDTSFQLSNRFKTTTRVDLVDMLEIIKRIRNNSFSISSDNSIIEYLISLFVMTFRQIKYSDLNQLYAYNSALIISRRLIQSMGL